MKTILLLCVAFLFVGNITAQENSPLYKIIIENDGTYEEREIILYLDSETKEFITKKEFIKKYNRDEFRIIEKIVDIAIQKEPVFNFHIKESGVVWQYIYDVDLTQDQIKEYFMNQTFMKLERETESGIIFSIDKMLLNTETVASWGSTPPFLKFPLSGGVTVPCKDNRYRVLFPNAVFTSDMNLSFGSIASNSNLQMSVGDYAYNYKRNKFMTGFKNTTARVMNDLFIDLFKIKEANIDTLGDW